MINLKAALAQDIAEGITAAQAAGDLVLPEKLPVIVVERPENPEHGDYASPVGLMLAKASGRPPMEVIDKIAQHMPKKEYTGKLEAVAPGFLNVRINPGWMTARLDDVLEGDVCSEINGGAGKRYNFEFISANPTGPMTLGNVRTAFSVDTLANVLQCAGVEVTREYYINDAGGQIRKLGESVLRRALQAAGEQVEYAEELYQGDYIAEVAAVIAERQREDEGRELKQADLQNPALIEELGQEAADMLLADIKRTVEDDLKIKFDVWASERVLRKSGAIEKARDVLRERGVLQVKDGAEYLQTTKFGDSEDRIFIKSDGEYAYIAPDVAYHADKYERGFDGIFTFVGADHQGHGPKLKAALAALGYDTAKLHVVAAQWMRLVRGGEAVKLSKRRGNIYTPKDLISEVGYDAARFFMVQHALTTHMDFDLDLAKERSEKNPVYYVQYAYVRLQSIMRQAKERGVIAQVGEEVKLTSHSPLTHSAEVALMREMYRLPEVIVDIADNLEVQALTFYARDLAKAIHFFYRHVKVLSEEDEEVRRGRLQLVVASRKVLGQVMDLLAISKPDVM